jgi:hypothetical protein
MVRARKTILYYVSNIDAHREGEGGIKVYPPPKFFAKLVDKNAIKQQKGVPFPKKFYNPCIPSLPKFGKNLMTLPLDFQTVCIYDFKWQLTVI